MINIDMTVIENDIATKGVALAPFSNHAIHFLKTSNEIVIIAEYNKDSTDRIKFTFDLSVGLSNSYEKCKEEIENFLNRDTV